MDTISYLGKFKFAKCSLIAFAASISPIAFSQSDQDETDAYDLPAFAVQGQQLGYNSTYGSTALKLQVPILETPQSLFVINDALIEDQQAFRLDQILQNDASVQKRNNFLGAYSSHYIRGFSLANGSNYLRNGRSFFHLASPPVEILERTEVLKGPASVLYGTVTPGGVINMVSKRPISQQAGFVKGTYGSDSLAHLHLDTGGPLNSEGTVRYRLNLVSEDSAYFRSFGNVEEFDVSRQIAYFALDWDVGENTTIRLNGDITEDDRPQDLGLIGGIPGLDFEALPRDVIISQPWTHYNSDVWNATAEVEHRFASQFYLKAGYSYQNYKRDRYDNQLRGVGPNPGDVVMRARRRVNRRDYYTYFADFNGDIQSGNVAHNILVGVDRTIVDRDDNETDRNVNFITNVFTPIYIDDPLIVTDSEKRLGEETRDGLYVQDMIELADQWRVLLGARYDDYEIEFRGSGYSTDNVAPRAGIVYMPQPNMSLYASYSESFEPNPPVSGTEFANDGASLDPTVGEMVEVGVKWELLEKRLLVSGALFSIDRANSPVEEMFDNPSPGGPDRIIVQRGLQRNKGLEAAVSGLVTKKLTVTASFAYLDAEFVDDENESLIGNTPAGASDIAASLWGEYQIDEGLFQGLSLQGGWFYEAERPVDNSNSFDFDAYHRFDLGLKFAMPLSERTGITYRLTASNVFNETYYKADRVNEISVERPREIRFSAQYTF